MTIFIAGGPDLVSRCLVNKLKKSNTPYISSYFTRSINNKIILNFNDTEELSNFFLLNNITVCVNCIVERQNDICEKDWEYTKKINIDYATNIARACEKHNIHLIHISTDYVFDGKTQPNKPESPTNPLQDYGISKLISELRVKQSCINCLIIRVPILYWDKVEYLDECEITLIGKKVLNQIDTFEEDNDNIQRPVFIPDFCNFILYCILQKIVGIKHFFNPNDKFTKYQIAQLIAKSVNKPCTHILPSKYNSINRPYDTQIIDTSYSVHNFISNNFQQNINKCFNKFIHPEIGVSKDIFLLFDLDGTLVDTDYIHYDSYKKVLSQYDILFSYEEFTKVLHYSSVDTLLKEMNIDFQNVKKQKNEVFKQNKNIKFIEGAEELLYKCLQNGINFSIVTNTSRELVTYIQTQLPLLGQVKQWILREDYNLPKPHDECYILAKEKYYKGEKFCIGFENSIKGYKAIKNSCQCVYFIIENKNHIYTEIKKEDVYLYPNMKINTYP
jgi:dTDP-4-dehydrorhamnose reductase/beta-phosphoglucomutase-like phosphatase (HAD superfamily)